MTQYVTADQAARILFSGQYDSLSVEDFRARFVVVTPKELIDIHNREKLAKLSQKDRKTLATCVAINRPNGCRECSPPCYSRVGISFGEWGTFWEDEEKRLKE